MEEKRRKYMNKLAEERRHTLRMIEMNKKSVANLEYSNNSKEYIHKRLEQIEESNKRNMEKVDELRGRETKVVRGELDDEVLAQYVSNNKSKKVDVLEPSGEDIEMSKKFNKGEKDEERRVKRLEKDISYYYGHYLRSVDSIPNYMKSNLASMPNNKGYIWKGIHLYGDLPTKTDYPLTLFEKIGKEPLIIHEWLENGTYRKWKKEDNKPKVLIQNKIN